jgi:hypothetical protein
MRTWLYGLAAVIFLVLVITAFASGEPSFAIPIVLLALVVFAFFALNDRIAKRELQRHDGDMQSVQADDEAAVPTAHVIADDATALGDTAEAHAEVSPHDFPRDSPARKAAEAQAAAGPGDTTRGNEDPSDTDDDERVTGSTGGSA